MQELRKRLNEEILKYKDTCFELNKYMADHPETAGEEYESSKKIVELLRENGFDVEYPFMGLETAFFAKRDSKERKYKIAVMVEFDALPGLGHACGHCLSGSISVLAGLALTHLQDELDAEIHIIGTPKEEHGGDKVPMAENGVFDSYDMAMMVHMYDKNMLATTLLAVESFDLYYYGKASHAANAPWEGRNALNGMQLFFHGMDMLRQHVKPDVRMHAVINNGGKRANIVPEETKAEVYVRSLDRKYLKEVVSMVEDCAKGAAIATQTTWKRDDADGHVYDDLLMLDNGLEVLNQIYQELDLNVTPHENIVFGSSDAGNVSYCCPTFHPALQVVEEGISIHTREFEAAMKTSKAYEALENGAKIIAYMVADMTSDPERMAAMKKEFEEKRK